MPVILEQEAVLKTFIPLKLTKTRYIDTRHFFDLGQLKIVQVVLVARRLDDQFVLPHAVHHVIKTHPVAIHFRLHGRKYRHFAQDRAHLPAGLVRGRSRAAHRKDLRRCLRLVALAERTSGRLLRRLTRAVFRRTTPSLSGNDGPVTHHRISSKFRHAFLS